MGAVRSPRPVPAVCNERLVEVEILKKKYNNLNEETYWAGLLSDTTQVERPQNGARSHDLPGSMVAQRVEAKHMPGKSEINANC